MRHWSRANATPPPAHHIANPQAAPFLPPISEPTVSRANGGPPNSTAMAGRGRCKDRHGWRGDRSVHPVVEASEVRSRAARACTTCPPLSDGGAVHGAEGVNACGARSFGDFRPALHQQRPQHRPMAMRLILAIAPDRQMGLVRQRGQHVEQSRGIAFVHLGAEAAHECVPSLLVVCRLRGLGLLDEPPATATAAASTRRRNRGWRTPLSARRAAGAARCRCAGLRRDGGVRRDGRCVVS